MFLLTSARNVYQAYFFMLLSHHVAKVIGKQEKVKNLLIISIHSGKEKIDSKN